MSNKNFDRYLKKFEEYGKKVTSSDLENQKFLKNLGILTASGKPSKKYKELTAS